MELGARLLADGWRVRGTTRDPRRAAGIERAGIEPAVADPDRVGTVLDHVHDVSVVAWLLASAAGQPDSVAALHAARLERMLEELVDTPVRGFVYEARGSAPDAVLRGGVGIVAAAAERWRIPVATIDHDPGDAGWAGAATAAVATTTAAGP